MSKFVKPNIDRTFYLFSDKAIKSFNGSGNITSIVPITAGTGYTSTGSVATITGGGGVDASVSPIITGSITSVNIVDGGSGYSSVASTVPLTKYPRENLTDFSHTYTTGFITTVRVIASDYFYYDPNDLNGDGDPYTDNYAPWRIFDYRKFWASHEWASLATYHPFTKVSLDPTKYFNNDTSFYGEWLMVDLGEAIQLQYYILCHVNGFQELAPSDFRIYGTNKNSSWNNPKSGDWVLLDTQINLQQTDWVDDTPNQFTTNISTSYRYYAIIVNKILYIEDRLTVGTLQISQWELYGTKQTNLTTITTSIGSGAILEPVITNGSITSVNIINGGNNYTSLSTLNVIGDGTDAILQPTITGGITSYVINNGGKGFLTAPTLSVSIGTGATSIINFQPERVYEYRWDTPDINLNDVGKLSLITRGYKTMSVTATPITTRILDMSHKDIIDTNNGNGLILDCSTWDYLKPFVRQEPITLSPQVINNITLAIDDDLSINGSGCTSTNVFCIVLKLTEGDLDRVEFGSTNNVNVNQRQISYY